MVKQITTYIGHDAKEELLKYIRSKKLNNFTIVTDQNEYGVLGRSIESSLKKAGFKSELILLDGQPVKPDEEYILQVLSRMGDRKKIFISIGSGTVTDITRFVAFRARTQFISMPTAPSMDGYAASGSSLTLRGLKQTIYSRPPIAIFADLDVLCNAPRPMISAGFGDTFGKYSALADWKLAHLIWGDRYHPAIAARVAKSLDACARLVEDLEIEWEANIRALMNALIEVGVCMYLAGTTRPASGAEHSLSHFWEMKMMREGRPAIYHGTKVGFAEILIAKQYDTLRKITRQEAIHLIRETSRPDPFQEEIRIRNSFGAQANQVLELQRPFIHISDEDFKTKQQAIISKWDEIQGFAASVPREETIVALAKMVGLPTMPDVIHLNDDDIQQAFQSAHYARGAFTILKLFKFLGLEPK